MPSSARPARSRRPFRALPPISRGPEAVEGMDVLHEVPGDAGVVLWQSLRNVLLWARTPPDERGTTFARAAAERRAQALREVAVDEALREPLHAVAALLSGPDACDAERIARACDGMSRWAESRAASATALAFAQAAALARPDDAARACAVGRLARRNGEPVRAEGWLYQAIVLGRHSGDWTSYARAFLGLGNLAVQRGNLPRARRLHVRALKAARRHRLRGVEAQALHDLFVTTAETGSDAEAREAAAGALRAYGSGHPRLPVLAADVACFWVARGQFARALPVLRAAAARLADPVEQVVVLSNAARAAGGMGDRAGYADASRRVGLLLAGGAAAGAAAQAWLNLARGAASLGDAEGAARAAREAIAQAALRPQEKVRATAESLIAAAEAGSLDSHSRPIGTMEDEKGGLLADELVRCLAVGV